MCIKYFSVLGKTHECWKLCAISLLRECDDLLQNMANNLLPSCINGKYMHMYEYIDTVYHDTVLHEYQSIKNGYIRRSVLCEILVYLNLWLEV